MSNTVSDVYSDAFFELSLEKNSLLENAKQIKRLGDLLEENQALRRIFENPNIDKTEKKEILDQLFTDTNIETLNFAKVLIDKQRFGQLDDIIHAFLEKTDRHQGISRGFIYSARPLEKEQVAQISKVVSEQINKQVELENKLDENLIGGFTVMVDGKYIDNSLKGRLEDLKSSLKQKKR